MISGVDTLYKLCLNKMANIFQFIFQMYFNELNGFISNTIPLKCV